MADAKQGKKRPAKKKAAKKSGKKVPSKASPRLAKVKAAWTFPKNNLEDALRVARAIEDKNAGNPMKASILVKAVGYHQANDWRFLDLLRSANQYGLVFGTGASSAAQRL